MGNLEELTFTLNNRSDLICFDMPCPFWNFEPRIDLFASRLNHQCPVYVACRPDPEAMSINAFTLSWSGIQFYAFPPFCIIPSMLQKMTKDKAQGVVVVPQSAVVSKASNHADIKTSAALSQRRYATATNGSEGKAPSKKTPAPSYLQNLRSRLRSSVFFVLFFKQTVSILCSSWRAETKNQYATYI